MRLLGVLVQKTLGGVDTETKEPKQIHRPLVHEDVIENIEAKPLY